MLWRGWSWDGCLIKWCLFCWRITLIVTFTSLYILNSGSQCNGNKSRDVQSDNLRNTHLIVQYGQRSIKSTTIPNSSCSRARKARRSFINLPSFFKKLAANWGRNGRNRRIICIIPILQAEKSLCLWWNFGSAIILQSTLIDFSRQSRQLSIRPTSLNSRLKSKSNIPWSILRYLLNLPISQ